MHRRCVLAVRLEEAIRYISFGTAVVVQKRSVKYEQVKILPDEKFPRRVGIKTTAFERCSIWVSKEAQWIFMPTQTSLLGFNV